MCSTCCKKKKKKLNWLYLDLRWKYSNSIAYIVTHLIITKCDATDMLNSLAQTGLRLFFFFVLKTSTYDLYFDYCRATQFELVNWIKFSQSRYALWRFDGDWRLWWVPNWTFSSWLGQTDSASIDSPKSKRRTSGHTRRRRLNLIGYAVYRYIVYI
jgi:hypothetical protein